MHRHSLTSVPGASISVLNPRPASLSTVKTTHLPRIKDLSFKLPINGAVPASVITYMTGESLTTPFRGLSSGQNEPLSPRNLPVRAMIGGRDAHVLFAGMTLRSVVSPK